jgi:hypothetical protein
VKAYPFFYHSPHTGLGPLRHLAVRLKMYGGIKIKLCNQKSAGPGLGRRSNGSHSHGETVWDLTFIQNCDVLFTMVICILMDTLIFVF